MGWGGGLNWDSPEKCKLRTDFSRVGRVGYWSEGVHSSAEGGVGLSEQTVLRPNAALICGTSAAPRGGAAKAHLSI